MAPDEKEPVRRPGGAARASENIRGTSGSPSARTTKAVAPPARQDAPTVARTGGSVAQAASVTRPRRRGVERLLLSLGALASVGVLLTACTIGYFNWRLGQIRRIDLDLVTAAAVSWCCNSNRSRLRRTYQLVRTSRCSRTIWQAPNRS